MTGVAASGTDGTGEWPAVEEPAPEELVMGTPMLRPPEQVADETPAPEDEDPGERI